MSEKELMNKFIIAQQTRETPSPMMAYIYKNYCNLHNPSGQGEI
jgi:hypothetical protein